MYCLVIFHFIFYLFLFIYFIFLFITILVIFLHFLHAAPYFVMCSCIIPTLLLPKSCYVGVVYTYLFPLDLFLDLFFPSDP